MSPKRRQLFRSLRCWAGLGCCARISSGRLLSRPKDRAKRCLPNLPRCPKLPVFCFSSGPNMLLQKVGAFFHFQVLLLQREAYRVHNTARFTVAHRAHIDNGGARHFMQPPPHHTLYHRPSQARSVSLPPARRYRSQIDGETVQNCLQPAHQAAHPTPTPSPNHPHQLVSAAHQRQTHAHSSTVIATARSPQGDSSLTPCLPVCLVCAVCVGHRYLRYLACRYPAPEK